MAFPIFLTIISFSQARTPPSESVPAGCGSNGSGRLCSLFSFRSPASLFPPSAVIRLTDDNSTFFLARPAAFGSLLPALGLSSQLWVGSGFGEERNLHSRSEASLEGELGCSDVPGWREDDSMSPGRKTYVNQDYSLPLIPRQPGLRPVNHDNANGKHGRMLKRDGSDITYGDNDDEMPTLVDDGTDDHLHHPLPESNPAQPAKPGEAADSDPDSDNSRPPTHADIQSLQESAEIAGKVVLLSRGGCGFLEKVKWTQRRGGVALIVGDDVRGGPLITMYARGDTSNVTIPALFTSHTTAHLLSSLIPSEARHESGSVHRDGDLPRVASSSNTDSENEIVSGHSWKRHDVKQPSVFARLLSFWPSSSRAPESSKRPEERQESSRNSAFVWNLVSGWHVPKATINKQEQHGPARPGSQAEASQSPPRRSTSAAHPEARDDFLIGVQDWRDPDMLVPFEAQDVSGTTTGGTSSVSTALKSVAPNSPASNKPQNVDGLHDASVLEEEGSGNHFRGSHWQSSQGNQLSSSSSSPSFASHDDDDNDGDKYQPSWANPIHWLKPPSLPSAVKSARDDLPGDVRHYQDITSTKSATTHLITSQHDGLWVTLTPATMSASPFFDTLLVLVVSPLVTLTLVYSLLVLRSRIRRRRWRAPKSVVERLPVRTYHTMSRPSSSVSTRTTTPITSSPASPLLRSSSGMISVSNRPRSHTTSAVMPRSIVHSDEAQPSSSCSSLGPQEKGGAAAAAAAAAPTLGNGYVGRQVECCVCLEEYVPGQSRVMSLPCGHEFHADCM